RSARSRRVTLWLTISARLYTRRYFWKSATSTPSSLKTCCSVLLIGLVSNGGGEPVRTSTGSISHRGPVFVTRRLLTYWITCPATLLLRPGVRGLSANHWLP